MKPCWLLLTVWIGVLAPALAQERPVKLDLASCRVPAQGVPENLLALIGVHAKIYAPYLVICPVVNHSGMKVLKILALREDKAAADNHLYFVHGKPWDGVNGADLHDAADSVPNPIVLTEDDKVVGTLPEPLFRDGPGVTTVSFGDWKAGRPGRISMRVDDAAVLGSYCPPALAWDVALGRYVAKAGDEFQACTGRP